MLSLLVHVNIWSHNNMGEGVGVHEVGLCMVGVCVWWGCAWQGACVAGACMVEGVHGRGMQNGDWGWGGR